MPENKAFGGQSKQWTFLSHWNFWIQLEQNRIFVGFFNFLELAEI